MKLSYYIDGPKKRFFPQYNPLQIHGWFIDEQGRAAREIRVKVGKQICVAKPQARPDVIAANVHFQPGSRDPGFQVYLKTGPGLKYIQIDAVTCDNRVISIWRHLAWMPKATHSYNESKPLQKTPWAEGQKHFLNEAILKQLTSINKSTSDASTSAKITVVVPIYNASDHLRRCLASLSKHLPTEHAILLVDDCSPDPAISQICLEFVQVHLNARYERNATNLGFVGSCNRAIFALDQTNNDIILLNSDTELTSDAIPELQAVLRISDRHFAVCPRSNQATILSFPRNYSCKAEASFYLWEESRLNLPRYQIIPTFVGFCVLLRRDLLHLFGGLDPVYGRGYNEENDLAARANRFGYSSVVANHAYVFHHEGSSFGPERVALDQKNRRILIDRYPEYGTTDSFWCEVNMHPVERFARPKRKVKRILIDLTQLPAAYNGTSIYCLDISSSLARKFRGKFEIVAWTNPAAASFHSISLECISDVRIDTPKSEDVFDLIFTPMQIWQRDHLAICCKLAPRFIWTLHDIISLRSNYLFDPARWSVLRQAIKLADVTVSISDYTKQDANTFFGAIGRFATIRNGPNKNWKPNIAKTDRILIIGNRYAHKAIAETLVLLKHLALHIDILGPVDAVPEFSKQGRESGHLDQTVIDELMQNCKVVVFPSLYEGFGYPAYEASVRGKIVIVHDNPLNRELSAAGLLANTFFFRSFQEIPQLVETARAATPNQAAPSVDNDRMVNEYAELIIDSLSRPPDYKLLEQRWQWSLDLL